MMSTNGVIEKLSFCSFFHVVVCHRVKRMSTRKRFQNCFTEKTRRNFVLKTSSVKGRLTETHIKKTLNA